MGFSQELQDFSEGFGAGFKMVDSRSDREAKKLEAEKLRQQIRRGEIELDPDFLRIEREGKLQTIESQKGETALRGAQTEELNYKNTPEYRAAEEASRQADIDSQDAAARLNRANAKIAEAQTAPERLKAQDEKLAAETALTEANARQTNATAALEEAKVTPERLKAADEEARLNREKTAADTESTRETTRGTRLDNDTKQRFQDILKEKTQGIKKRMGIYLGGENVPESAVEVPEAPAETPAETPGPQSAVEVPGDEAPGDTMSTTEAPDPDAEAGEPVEAAAPLVQTAGIDVEARGETEAEAVPTEAGLAPEAPEVKQVSAREAGPRAHPHVDEQQSRTAKTRKQPLAASTVNVLEYAGDKTGIRAVVFSGGQAHKGEEGPRTGSTRHDGGLAADVRLYDAKTNRMLNMSNPEDAQRMHDFGMYAVQAGATGIGAGEGYMGNNSMHIGFGNEATWGGASWIADAHAKGKATRDQATGLPGDIKGELPEMFQSGSIHKSAKDAALAGMKYAIGNYGLDQDSAVDSPEMEQAGAAYQSGEFGADPEQVEEVERIVQEVAREAGGELSEAETPMYALAALYEAYLGVGDTEGAQKAAAALMGHYKQLFSQYGAVAKAAAEQGDIDGAVEAAARAYANVPDGMDVEFNQIGDGSYEVVMTNQETGEITNRQIATPDEIGGLIMEVNPGHFEQLMSQAAGMESKSISSVAATELSKELGIPPEQLAQMTEAEVEEVRLARNANKPKTSTAKKSGPSQSDIDSIITDVDAAFTSFTSNLQQSETADETDINRLADNSDAMMEIRPVVEQLAIDNAGTVRPALVVEAVVHMLDRAPTSARATEDGRIEVSVEGSPPLTMHSDLYHRLSASRARFSPEDEARQATLQQNLRDIRQAPEFAPGFVPDYDPTRYPVGTRTGGVEEAVPAGPVPRGRTGQPMQTIETPVTRQGGRIQLNTPPRRVGGSGSRTGR